METLNVFKKLFEMLPKLTDHHVPGCELYSLLEHTVRKEVESFFSDSEAKPREFPPFGTLVFPYHSMGTRDSLNLFDLDELIIFSYYWANRTKYSRVIDAGANIGLHSVILSKCGMQVRSYEPDPQHFDLLQRNIVLNECNQVEIFKKALASTAGEREFIRVLGNTTGSHLAGAKSNPYGNLDRFEVIVDEFQPLMGWADLIKMDVEGQERDILLSTGIEDWWDTDALIEVSSEDNAKALYQHFGNLNINMFSQKTGWNLVQDFQDIPKSYKDGTLFVSSKNEMTWQRVC